MENEQDVPAGALNDWDKIFHPDYVMQIRDFIRGVISDELRELDDEEVTAGALITGIVEGVEANDGQIVYVEFNKMIKNFCQTAITMALIKSVRDNSNEGYSDDR